MSLVGLLPALEWSGAVLGLIGSALLAMKTRLSGWGFVAFLLSNLCWIGFALQCEAYGLLAMQSGFTMTSALGIYRWLLARRPPLSSSQSTLVDQAPGGLQ